MQLNDVFSEYNVKYFVSYKKMLQIATKERIQRYTHLSNLICVLCDEDVKTVDHLFLKCRWSFEAFQKLQSWLQWQCSDVKLQRVSMWLQRCKRLKVQKKVFQAALAALVYGIWRARNKRIWEGEVTSVDSLMG